MAASPSARPLGRPLARLRASTLARNGVLASDAGLLVLLGLGALVVGWAAETYPRWVPPSTLAVVLLVGGAVLARRRLVALCGLVAGVVLALIAGGGTEAVPPGSLLVIGAAAALVLHTSRARNELGVQGTRGESMLVDLRDRLAAHGELPVLPRGWEAEVVTRSAGASSFSGDFLVASLPVGSARLEIALVDVSGKGVDAGTRSLLLSGAFGGLLGALPREQFLPAANAYLLRQGWAEEFATAAHLTVDLDTGDYWVASAGHPPAAQFQASAGRWEVHDAATGPVLGLAPSAEFSAVRGRLGSGDAILLFTDGLVERSRRDISQGIDKLLGQAERLVGRGFEGAARTLVSRVGARDDDCALVLVHRR